MSVKVVGSKTKVLIVEDEKAMRNLLETELSRSGYQVTVAVDGMEGMVKYSEESFNVVLLDVKMPGLNGVEVLRQMRNLSNLPEIIMFTGHGEIETAVECIKLGAYDYITKPVKLDELELVIIKAGDKNQLRLENINLKHEIDKHTDHPFVGKSPEFMMVINLTKRWGGTSEHVLIFGESGTGKELAARAVHDASPRSSKPFVTVNCGRLDANTAESELFGHMQGAFTSANKSRPGLFELADGGTLFMDEVSEMNLDVQVKLLRILETGCFRRLGGTRDIRVDVRFVFATNRKLEECVERGTFREDLFHRINLLPISIPPLRERREDIVPLAMHFLKEYGSHGNGPWEITEETIKALCAYDWPGNVRELKNTMRRACVLATENLITVDLLPFSTASLPAMIVPQTKESGGKLSPLWVVEREHIAKVIAAVDGNKSMASRLLEIDRKTLYTKLERYSLDS
jgi:DNA-binding NtrC family response regulator